MRQPSATWADRRSHTYRTSQGRALREPRQAAAAPRRSGTIAFRVSRCLVRAGGGAGGEVPRVPPLLGPHRGPLVHGLAVSGRLGLLLRREVELDLRDGGVVGQAAGVLGHLEVDVPLLPPGRGPRVAHDPVGRGTGCVEAGSHHTMVLQLG
eukprot:scaffold104724_cov63-Phaeocystis_antarctica.AAC.1